MMESNDLADAVLKQLMECWMGQGIMPKLFSESLNRMLRTGTANIFTNIGIQENGSIQIQFKLLKNKDVYSGCAEKMVTDFSYHATS